MGQIIPTKIVRFDGGQSDDPRSPVLNAGALLKHFDCFSNPHRLTPYRSTEADTSTSVSSTDLEQYKVRDFILASNGKLYGLGETGAGLTKIFSKADPTTGNWTVEATAEGNGAVLHGCFIEWQGALWFFQGTNQIGMWVIATNTITNTVTGVLGSTITSVAQGVIANNTLYMFYNNKVVAVNSSSARADDQFTTLPSDMRITSCARYGAYMMIGMAFGTATTNITAGRSIVVQWDMNSTTTPSDTIDWGEGALRVLGNIEGRICGVSDKYLTSTLGLARGSMVVRLWAGGAPQVMKEVVANQTVTADTATITRFPSNVVIKNNKMYWVASVPFGLSTSTQSTHHLGIWVFGRKNVDSNFTIALDYIEEAVTNAAYYINSFGAAGDYWFISYGADGKVTKTDNDANYTYKSIYDSQIFNGGDVASYKSLIDVTVGTVYLPAAGQIICSYRIDNETLYTPIFTNTTDNSISHTANNIESSGAALPKSYKELQIRLESTGGAEITELSFNEENNGRKYITD